MYIPIYKKNKIYYFVVEKNIYFLNFKKNIKIYSNNTISALFEPKQFP